MSLAISLLLLVATAAAQDLRFRRLPAAGLSPSGRIDSAPVFDPPSGQLFVFGGQDDSGLRNDLWAYSFDKLQWRELNPAGGPPGPRFGHTATYDPVRRRVIVFGGQGRGFFSDVWAYDIAANVWQQLAPGGSGPSNRYGHSAIYDARRNRVVISHGFTDQGRFDDTWAFDLRFNSWTNLSPASNRPLRRCLHHAEYGESRDRMYLYGGCASGFGPCPLGDLWEFDLASNRWREIRPAAGASVPAPRQHYGFGYDSRRERLVLFGGNGGGDRNDTWTFDPATEKWAEVQPANPPEPRSRHEGTYISLLDATLFFGGQSSSKVAELIALEPGVASPAPEILSQGVRNSFSGAQGPISPGELRSIYGSNLGLSEGISAQFDLSGRLPVELGGASVLVNGVAAPLLFVRADQINFQVPYEISASQVQIEVAVNGTLSAAQTLSVSPTAPALHQSIFHQNGSLNTTASPSASGGVVTFFATGTGVTTPPSRTGERPPASLPPPSANIQLMIGGRPAETLFVGSAPGTAGVIQINARVPEGLNGAVPVILMAGDRASSPVILTVDR